MTSNSDYRFYIVGTGNDYIKFMWKDAIENDNVFYLENPMSAKFPLRDLYNSIYNSTSETEALQNCEWGETPEF